MFDTFSIPEHKLPIVNLQDLFGLRSDGEEDKPSLSSLVLDSVPTAVILPAVGLSQKSADSSEVSQASGAWGKVSRYCHSFSSLSFFWFWPSFRFHPLESYTISNIMFAQVVRECQTSPDITDRSAETSTQTTPPAIKHPDR